VAKYVYIDIYVYYCVRVSGITIYIYIQYETHRICKVGAVDWRWFVLVCGGQRGVQRKQRLDVRIEKRVVNQHAAGALGLGFRVKGLG